MVVGKVQVMTTLTANVSVLFNSSMELLIILMNSVLMSVIPSPTTTHMLSKRNAMTSGALDTHSNSNTSIRKGTCIPTPHNVKEDRPDETGNRAARRRYRVRNPR